VVNSGELWGERPGCHKHTLTCTVINLVSVTVG